MERSMVVISPLTKYSAAAVQPSRATRSFWSSSLRVSRSFWSSSLRVERSFWSCKGRSCRGRKMHDAHYALIVTIVLGLAHMCMFVGYDTGSFIVESVLHSVHDRRPDTMDEHAGYYGQAIVNAFNMVGHIVAPAVLCFMNAKWTMVVGSLFFTLSFASYMLMNEYVIYVSSAFLGIMFAVFNAGYSRYLTQISTVATIEKVNGLEWSLACFSTLVGGFLYIPLTKLDPAATEPSLYRNYSDTQIRLMYGTFTVIGIIANLVLCFLPNREIANSISSIAADNTENKGGKVIEIRESITLTLKSFFDPMILQLTPHFIYVGLQNSVYLSIFPTTLQFTESLSQNIFATAYYGMTFSLGSIIMGTLMAPLSRRIAHFGQTPCLALAMGLQALCAILMLLSTPNQSTITPNNDPSLLIPPNLPVALVMGFLYGLLDSCNNTNRTVMCATAFPSKRAQAFAIARFYQAFAGSVLLFCSPLITVYILLGVEAISCVIGAILYLRVVYVLRRSHRPPESSVSSQQSSVTTVSKIVDENENVTS